MKNLNHVILVAVISTLGLFSCSESINTNPVLTIEGGKIMGVVSPAEGIIAYKGIPFAAPPIGDLRWKEPQPVIPWEGVKIADTYGAAAMQTLWEPESFYDREWQARDSARLNEDCLYLNVWTPAPGKTDEKLPVTIWIHGGGYQGGFAFEPEMDGGEDWASQGVIFVSITYRLGVFGFFSHPLLSAESPNGVSGNYGLMDQAAAMRWVNNSIEQFGGDPNNITIFGQSAGACSVQALCASDQSKHLVSKAISMSGGGLNDIIPATPIDSTQKANKVMMDYFEKTTLEEMRALSFEELKQMTNEYANATSISLRWNPVIDNYFLSDNFSKIARKNEIADIPYMFGCTANDIDNWTNHIQNFCALRSEQSDKPAFAYLFKRQLPGDNSGAFHSSDLWYVFHAFEHSWRPFTSGDEKLSIQLVDYWTNFAKYGNPNGEDAGIWTPYTLETPEFMIFDANDNEAIFTMTSEPEFIEANWPL